MTLSFVWFRLYVLCLFVLVINYICSGDQLWWSIPSGSLPRYCCNLQLLFLLWLIKYLSIYLCIHPRLLPNAVLRRRCCWMPGARCRSMSFASGTLSSKPAASCCCCRMMGQTDRRSTFFIDPALAPRSKTLVCVLTVRLEYRPVKSTMLSVSEIQISKFGTWNSVTGVRGIWNSAGYHYIPIMSDIYNKVFFQNKWKKKLYRAELGRPITIHLENGC